MHTVEECFEHADRLIEKRLDVERDKESIEALRNTAFWIARARISLHKVKQEIQDVEIAKSV